MLAKLQRAPFPHFCTGQAKEDMHSVPSFAASAPAPAVVSIVTLFPAFVTFVIGIETPSAAGRRAGASVPRLGPGFAR